jgi:hypothetical protein
MRQQAGGAFGFVVGHGIAIAGERPFSMPDA